MLALQAFFPFREKRRGRQKAAPGHYYWRNKPVTDIGSASFSVEDVDDVMLVIGIPCLTGKSPKVFAAYLALLMKWNAVMNLVGATRWDDALRNLLRTASTWRFF